MRWIFRPICWLWDHDWQKVWTEWSYPTFESGFTEPLWQEHKCRRCGETGRD